jgi:hypothetical protein
MIARLAHKWLNISELAIMNSKEAKAKHNE